MNAYVRWPCRLPTLAGSGWLSLLGVVIYAGWMGAQAFASPVRDEEAPAFLAGALVMGGIVWWLLLSLRLFRWGWEAAGLRLPGIERHLLRGTLVHLLLSLGLPGLGLWLWQPQHLDIIHLITLLWLGTTLGLLVVSLPPVAGMLPVGLILSNTQWLSDTWLNLWLGVAALIAAALLWRWHLRGKRSIFLAPCAVWLDMPLRLWPERSLSRPSRVSGTLVGQQTPQHGVNTRDALAAVLGFRCQTVRQLYGRRGQCLILLIVACVILGAAVFYDRHEVRSVPLFFNAMLAFSLVLVTQQSALRLASLHLAHRASLAELMLLPGLPGREALAAAVFRQVASSLVERILWLACTLPACVIMGHGLDVAWLLGWLALVLIALVLSLASAWLAWNRPRRYKGWAMWQSTFMLVGIQTLVMAPMNLANPAMLWLVPGGWSLLMVGVFLVKARASTTGS